MRNLGIFICALIALTITAYAQEKETPATPMYQIAPSYPLACQQALGGDPSPQRISVTFDVTRDGEAENIRVRESAHECFNEASITAVRGWVYEPRRVNRERERHEDLEVTFKFLLEEPTTAYEFDARPIKRVPPQYPANCARKAKNRETVIVGFDVNAVGETENIVILDSTNSCLNDAALKSVTRWKYSPMMLDGESAPRPNVQTMITFELDGGAVSRTEFRRGVRAGLLSAQRLATEKKDIAGALAELEQLEQKYGDSLSNSELSAFYQIRGVIRIEAKDYIGALDDFRITRGLGIGTAKAAKAINETVVELERAIGLKPVETLPSNETEAGSESGGDGREH